LATLAKGEKLKAMLLELSTSWQMLALGLESVLGTPNESQAVSSGGQVLLKTGRPV
jgi:hypothetical protein